MARKPRPPRTPRDEPDSDEAARSPAAEEVRDPHEGEQRLPDAEAAGNDSAVAGSQPLELGAADRIPPRDESTPEPPTGDPEARLSSEPAEEQVPGNAADAAPRRDEGDAEPVTESPQPTPRDEVVPETDTAPQVDPKPPTETEAAIPPAAPPPPRRRSGVVGLLLGGALAAALGFLAAQYTDPRGWPFSDPAAETLASEVASQTQRLRAMESELADLRAVVTESATPALAEAVEGMASQQDEFRRDLAEGLSSLSGRIEALDASVASLSDTSSVLEAAAAALADRVEAIERAPIDSAATAEAAVESYRQELAELRARIETVIAENEAMRAEVRAQIDAAEAAARAGRARAALVRIEAAVDGGGSFEDALRDLSEAGFEPPPVLAQHAASGIPTRGELQATFAPAARDALAAALSDVEGLGFADRARAFFRVQFGVRSLSPRAGDDADAILSRAEAALAADDIGRALGELAGLPDAAQAAMAEWAAAAAVRKDARDALAALSAEIETL